MTKPDPMYATSFNWKIKLPIRCLKNSWKTTGKIAYGYGMTCRAHLSYITITNNPCGWEGRAIEWQWHYNPQLPRPPPPNSANISEYVIPLLKKTA